MRTRYRVQVQLSSDPVRESKNHGNHQDEVVSDGLGEGYSGEFTLAAGATDVLLTCSQVASASFLFISTAPKSDLDTPSDILIRLSSITGEQITISPLPTTKQGHLLLSTTGLTAIYVSNPGTVAMTVVVALAGD